MSVISSVVHSDRDALRSILDLHCGGDSTFDLDPCFSKGNFYKGTGISYPRYIFDKSPQSEFVRQADSANLPVDSESIKSVIFDPPFMFGSHGQTKNNAMNKRFSMFDSWQQLQDMYTQSLYEFYRVLVNGGILAFKCQDYTDSMTTMTHCYVWNWATAAGFYARATCSFCIGKGGVCITRICGKDTRASFIRIIGCFKSEHAEKRIQKMSDLTKFIQDRIEIAEAEREKAYSDQALSEYLTGKIDALWIVLREIQHDGKARQFPIFRKVRVTRGTWAGAVGTVVERHNNRLLVKIGGTLVWLSNMAVEVDAEEGDKG